MKIERAKGTDLIGGWAWDYDTIRTIEDEMDKINDCNATMEDIDALLTVLDKAGVLIVAQEHVEKNCQTCVYDRTENYHCQYCWHNSSETHDNWKIRPSLKRTQK